MDDVQDHAAIRRAQPKGKDLREAFRNKRGATVRELEGGKVEVALEGLKEKREYIEMTQPARRLSSARGMKVQERNRSSQIEVRGELGRTRINVANEDLLARSGLIHAAMKFGGSVRYIADERGYQWRSDGKGGYEPTHKKTTSHLEEPDPSCQCMACNPVEARGVPEPRDVLGKPERFLADEYVPDIEDVMRED